MFNKIATFANGIFAAVKAFGIHLIALMAANTPFAHVAILLNMSIPL